MQREAVRSNAKRSVTNRLANAGSTKRKELQTSDPSPESATAQALLKCCSTRPTEKESFAQRKKHKSTACGSCSFCFTKCCTRRPPGLGGCSRKGKSPGLSIGGTVKSCRHCFEARPDSVEVITILRQIMKVCRELKIRGDGLAGLPRLRRGLRCSQPPLGG
jgi:hypothetical protein